MPAPIQIKCPKCLAVLSKHSDGNFYCYVSGCGAKVFYVEDIADIDYLESRLRAEEPTRPIQRIVTDLDKIKV